MELESICRVALLDSRNRRGNCRSLSPVRRQRGGGFRGGRRGRGRGRGGFHYNGEQYMPGYIYGILF